MRTTSMDDLISLEIGPVRALKALNPGLAHTIFFPLKKGGQTSRAEDEAPGCQNFGGAD